MAEVAMQGANSSSGAIQAIQSVYDNTKLTDTHL